jgi:serine/threonine protein kinase
METKSTLLRLYLEANGLSLLKTLGEGSYGAVHKCHDRVTAQNVAVKIFSLELYEGDYAWSEGFFEREVVIMEYLSGKQTDGTNFTPKVFKKMYNPQLGNAVSMQLFEAKSAHDLCPMIPSIFTGCCEMFMNAMIGLEWLHRQGIVHGDISMGNVMFTPENQVKLVDFGFSISSAELENGRLCKAGTAQFLSPERAQTHLYEKNEFTAVQSFELLCASDVWAMCVVFSRMYGLIPPWYKRHIEEPYQVVDWFKKNCHSHDAFLKRLDELWFLQFGLSTLWEDRPTASEYVKYMQDMIKMIEGSQGQ